MRTIGFRSNLLFAVAAAFGVIASLSRPWYGPSAKATDAQMEDLLAGVGRAFTEPVGTTGWAALETADQLIAGLAVGTAAVLLLTLVPALQQQLRPVARWGALATVGVILVKLVDTPDGRAFSEPRHGLFLALASGLVLVASTATVASAPSRRRKPVQPYTPPPPPKYDSDASYGPPQF
jgi:hypothetical protein